MSEKITKYEGKEVTAEDVGRRLAVVDYGLEPRYAWAAGVALGRFLRELRNGKIVGRQCVRCGRIMVPPRLFCEQCFRRTDSWVYVKDTGRVSTFSISYVATDASRLKRPEIVAVIELDGASPGMGILHLLGEVDPSKVKVGMRVKAVWKPKRRREGSITDIVYFKPLGED